MNKTKAMEGHKNGALVTIFLAVFIDLIGFGIVLPLLPFYASLFHSTAVQIGVLYSIYSFAQLIFSPIWGSLSDRIGRRPIMLISTLGSFIAYLLFAFSHSYLLLFISRLFAGVMGGNISTAQAYVADITTHEDRAKGMGLIGAAFGIGFVVGPALSTILIHPKFLSLFNISYFNRYALPGFVAAGLSFLSFILVFFKLTETIKECPSVKNLEDTRMRSAIFTKAFWAGLIEQARNGHKNIFYLLVISVFLLAFAQAALYGSFPLFCENKMGLDAEGVGMLFVLMGLIAVIVQGGLMKRLSQRFSEVKLFLTGSILLTVGLISIPFATSIILLIFFLSLMSIGASLSMPVLNSLISKEAHPLKVGAALGTSQGMSGLGRTIGPTWGGLLYDIWFGLPFILTAMVFSTTLFFGWKLRREKSRSA